MALDLLVVCVAPWEREVDGVMGSHLHVWWVIWWWWFVALVEGLFLKLVERWDGAAVIDVVEDAGNGNVVAQLGGAMLVVVVGAVLFVGVAERESFVVVKWESSVVGRRVVDEVGAQGMADDGEWRGCDAWE